MTDKKIVEEWNIVFALAEKGCGYFASYQAQVMDPRPCSGSDPWWVLIAGCPAGCTSSPPPGLPTNPYPCQPDYETDYHVTPEAIECCEGIVQVECSGTCCKCGGAICGATETCCDNVCVNTNTDEYHCGGCNIPCEPSGKCCPQPCDPDQCTNTTINWTWVPSGNCPATTENPYPEGGEWTTPDNCPSGCSGKVSPGFPMDVCGPSSATQQCACPLEGLPICIDITTKDNCGDCGIPCPDDKPACCNGICCTTENCCSIDDILTCIDVKNNHEHCGSCNHPCAAEEICCSGECANTQLDNDHCGSCPNKCPEGFICCSGVCKNVVGTDALNCGDCDRSCDGGEACKDGVCVDPCTTEECSFTWNEPTCTFFYNNPNGYKICFGTATVKWVPGRSVDGIIGNCYGHWETLIPCEYSENCGCADGWYPGSDEFTIGPCEAYTSECNCGHRPDAASPCLPFPVLDPDIGWAGGEWQQITACDRGGVNCQAPEDPPVIPECQGETYSFPCDPFWSSTPCPNCACPINQPDRDGTADLEKVSSACKKCHPDCGANQKCCNKVCKDVLTDESNCGFCGKVCAIGEECCNGDCIETQTSELHCGFCNNPCALFETCCAGSCRDLGTDEGYCGSCVNACAAGETCCNGICVNKNTDENNCGECEFECPNSDQCVDGNCVPCDPPCLEAGTACCNNQCVDILWNESRCGNCTTVCGLGQTCCNGICKNTQKDMYNCGDCGIECPQGINQINLWQCCNGQCKNLKTDPENCGFCGRVCREPPYDTFTVPKCFLGNCADPECECQGYEQGMPPQPGPNDLVFVASCVGNTTSCDGPCYFDAVGGAWVLHEEDGFGYSGTCGQEPDYTYCVDDKYACVDDKYACVGDIYYCVKNIEGQDMPTYCIPKASFNAVTQALIGEYIGAENCAAGCSGDGSVCDPACGNGLTCCSSTCVDTQTDSANCGGCGGGPCDDGEACKDGVCTGCMPPCSSGESCCEGGTTCCETCCEDTCCPTGQSCVEGVCATCEPPCTAGQTCCGGSCCDAGIICCDQTCCAAGEFCENGSCATCNPVCYPDETCCEATCVRWQCGECPNACASAEIACCGLPGQEVCCPEGQTCVENACYGCTPPCTASQDCCDEVCTEVGTDTNCSGCGDPCGEGTKCCDKVCTNITTTSNCGDCGIECAEGQDCCDGVPTTIGTDTDCSGCGDPCTGGKCCEGVCKETQTDNENCGDCEKVCNTAEGEKCVAGVCVTCDPPCTDLDVCCDLTCCKVCCGPDLGPKECCPSGLLCFNGQCTDCSPSCTEAGSSCCSNPNQQTPTEENPNIGECCPPGVLCCAGGCCPNENFYCCDNKVCCFNDRACCDGVCCAEGEFCDNGVCAGCNPVCYSDEKCCDGTCIRWQCGDCPNACTRFQTCSNGICCEPEDGVGCGTVCCEAGIACCRDICCLDPDEECCDGFCVNTQSIDNNNCGGCGSPCVPPGTCCNGSCRTVFNDIYNCGGCGNACSVGMLCCPDNGGCVYPSYLNCGSCGNECTVGQSCCPDGQGGHECLAQGSC